MKKWERISLFHAQGLNRSCANASGYVSKMWRERVERLVLTQAAFGIPN